MDHTAPNRPSTSSRRPQALHPQPSLQAAASSSSLIEAGNKSLERIRASSRSTTISSSASSSSTSLPRSILHRPPSARSGVSANAEMQRQGDVLSMSASEAGVIFGAEHSQTSPRLRTLSGSSSGNGHGRFGVKKRPPTPGSAVTSSPAGSAQLASRSASNVPLPSALSSRAPSTPALGSTAPPAPTHPRSPTSPRMSSMPTRLVTPPGLGTPSDSPQSNASTSAYSSPSPYRRPSLASPLPETPFIPSHLPKPAVRNPPAPLNLAAASPSTPLRHQHPYHTTTGSLSSPHALTHSPTAQGHHTQRMHSAPTPPPSSHVGAAPQGRSQSQSHHPNPSQGQGQSQATQGQAQSWAAHAQYVNVPRPGSGGLPDSPSTNAMMKRLLAKPAPISPAHGFGSGASGSDSESGRMGRVGANMRMRSKTKLRSSSPRGGVRSEEETVGGGVPPIEFDMDLDTLNRDIATMGQWITRQNASGSSERMISPATSMPNLKEKEKKVRNVLRRKPSANAANSSKPNSPLQSPSAPSPGRMSNAQPILIPSTSPTSQPSHLPPIGSFSPLSVSPLGLSRETFTKEDTAFIHPPAPHKPHAHAQNTSATMHRAASASAAIPTSSARVTRAPGVVQGQPVSSQSPLHPQRHHAAQTHQASPAPLGRASSLQPPSQHLRLPGSTRSAASSQPSSRGSSPGRSPVRNATLAGPTSATANLSSNRLPPLAQPQQSHLPILHSPISPTSPTSSKRISSSGKPTPAASVVEAYKKQEREREARRLAAEKERQERKEEREMTLGSNRKTVAEAKPFMAHAPRRHSVSGLDVLAAERTKEQTQTTQTEVGHGDGYVNSTIARLAASERTVAGLAAGSTLTVDSYTTTSSGPQISDDDNAGARTGMGFKAIEKLAGSVMADARAATVPSKLMSDARRQEFRIRSPGSDEGGEGVDVTPYYTVFGSSATRVAAADRPVEEGWAAYGQGYWDSDVLGRRTGVEGGKEKEKEGRKESFSRTLSRKVSGRWKKQGGSVVGTLIDDERQGRADMRGRASMQERRKAGSASRRDETDREVDARTKMRNRRSLRLSIDKFSDFLDREDPPAVPPLARGKGAVGGAGATRAKEVEVDSDCDTECEKEETRKSSKTKKEKEKEKTTTSPSGSTGSGGNRFWKLMRRISVGGLKEKYRDASLSPPPPVPALPKDIYNTLPALQASRSNDSSLKRHPIEAKKNKSASSSPTTATVPAAQKTVPPPALVPQAKASAAAPAVTPAATSSSQSRPSTNTRSSSPVSSDVASSKFFHRTHSAPSSTSSFEEERPPPLPKNLAGTNAMFLQHIVPPSELGKIYGHEEEAASTSRRARGISVSTHRVLRPDDDWQIVRSPSVELPSLPIPPRRLPQPPATGATINASETPEEIERSESPTIPSFSTSAVVNAFPARRLSSTLSSRSHASPNSPHASSPSSMLPSPSSVISPQNIISLPPPPRPLRSAQRPITIAARPPIIEEPPIATSAPIPIPAGRKSESHIGSVSPQPMFAHNRRSSGGMSGTSSTATARVLRRRSSSFGGGTTASSVRSLSLSLTTPPAGATTFTFREIDDANRPRQALTEREKAARWDDLLERSARAGGTLHLAGGAHMLASDRMKVSKW